jgi:hypothetical protein
MLLTGTTSHFILPRDAIEKLQAGKPNSLMILRADIGLRLSTDDYVDYGVSREDIEG